MKKLFIFLYFVIFAIKCYAIEEIQLETNGIDFNSVADFYYGKTEYTNKFSPFFKLFTQNGLELENSSINSIKLYLLYAGNLTYTKNNHSSQSLVHNFPIVEPMVKIKFNDNKSEFMFDYNIVRDIPNYSNSFTEKISRFYVSHDLSENQKLIIGQEARLPNTYNGSLSTMGQDFVLKSQLGRNFGEIMSVGIRNKGSYKYFDYDIGLYDSTRYMKDFGNGLDFTGYLMLKPLANIQDKAGSLHTGIGYNIGDYYNSYHMYSVFTSYDYKKFHIKGEFAQADGYNGIAASNNKAQGFYTALAYDILPKLQLTGRYDYFIPNELHKNNSSEEYTLGLTYKPFQNMKIILNYIFNDNNNTYNSNKILFTTRFLI